MPSLRHALVVALVALTLAGCSHLRRGPAETLYQARDFTPPDSFTSGAEGPAVDAKGNLFAVNFAEQGTIGHVTPDGQARVFVRLPEGSVGNGIRLDSRGRLLIADYTRHNVLVIDPASGETGILAHEPRMNQPNDVAITKRDIVFCSDPNWADRTGQIWRVTPDGAVTLLEAGIGTTNGIEVSPNEKRLYVGESRQRRILVYDLNKKGEISNKRVLIEFPDFGLDGIRCDVKGNLYVTRHGKGVVAIVSPEGRLLREVQLVGTKPSNIAFGGPDGRTCYVTNQDRCNVETFRTDTPGREWKMMRRWRR